MNYSVDFLCVHIPSYGLLIGIGLFLANYIAFFVCKNNHLNIYDLIILEAYGFLSGFVGARLLYIVIAVNSGEKFSFSMISNRGGFVFLGGIILAFPSVFIASRIHKIAIQPILYNVAFLIPFVHGFGRLGCFCAGCCYGIHYSGPFAVTFPETTMGEAGVPLFPVQLLEAFLLFGISILVYILSRKNRKSHPTVIYLTSYLVIRFFDEFLRGDSHRGIYGPFSLSQWICLGGFLCGLLALLFCRWRRLKNTNGETITDECVQKLEEMKD